MALLASFRVLLKLASNAIVAAPGPKYTLLALRLRFLDISEMKRPLVFSGRSEVGRRSFVFLSAVGFRRDALDLRVRNRGFPTTLVSYLRAKGIHFLEGGTYLVSSEIRLRVVFLVGLAFRPRNLEAVSYTHLTLPTIYSV